MIMWWSIKYCYTISIFPIETLRKGILLFSERRPLSFSRIKVVVFNSTLVLWTDREYFEHKFSVTLWQMTQNMTCILIPYQDLGAYCDIYGDACSIVHIVRYKLSPLVSAESLSRFIKQWVENLQQDQISAIHFIPQKRCIHLTKNCTLFVSEA